MSDPVPKAKKRRSFGKKFSKRFLAPLNLAAKTIFDVGVFRGTPPLYQSFPDCKFVLVDPLPTSEALVRGHFGRKFDFVFHQIALGREPGALELRMAKGTSGLIRISAELQARHQARRAEEGTMLVDVQRLDDLVAEHGYTGPFGIKLDVEGFELEVLRGAPHTLAQAEFVIGEFTLCRRFVEDYRFSDIVAVLAAANLELLSVLDDRPRLQRKYDCLFVRRGHPVFG